jgi:hypothetical protein
MRLRNFLIFLMKTNLLILCILWTATSCTPIAQSSGNSGSNPKTLQLIDQAYEPQIRTILLHPDGAPALPAVTRLGQWNLILEFDDLRGQNDTYYARIEHCNYNWTRSTLQDLDYMTTYNEFPINTYQFSVDTHIPYVHYSFTLPAVKLSGNYVLVVYRGSNKDDIILSRRFMVFDTRVTFTSDGNLIGPGSMANLNQQLNFTVSYQSLDILNPMMDVHVNIRQNHRWDNIVVDLKPSFLREIEKELEYRFFDESKMFRGGNEFRFFDLRSLNNPGRNVDHVNKTVKPFQAYIQKDKSRQGQAYAQYNDLNGNFNVDNYDFRDPAYTNYVKVNFELVSPPVSGDVYVAGAFNYWALNKENRMQYDSAQGMYTSNILLKQGWYDYQYLVKSSSVPPYFFEGSHFETENAYEVFVYYRPFQPQADLLIGYVSLEKNAR